ncbi:hypothetical protein DPMN_017173 [Dreissena polymorpha]|uniref:Uncharacterized protein n=1 Tax=Dreissena polymorpha TaxID=45954 RepID=A0A9D4NFZ2_DREPO|nr:hypothetical protein DPMN_017173 [Dreissena polymorpha]
MGGMRASHKSRQAYKSWESVLRLVSMKETHRKTMRILGIKSVLSNKHERTTLENHENIGNQYRVVRMKEPLWKTMRILGISTEESPGISTEKEPGIILSSKQGISTEY